MSSVMDANYNLTAILSNNLVTDTNKWAIAFNNEMGGLLGISFIAVIGIVIFVGMKYYNSNISDTEALTYAGFISSILSIFFIVLRNSEGALLEWTYALPIFVITAIAIYLHNTSRDF